MQADSRPRLRFYEWESFCITTGIFHDPAALVHLDRCRSMKIDVAIRPTGGGVLFHGADCALSIFLPRSVVTGSAEVLCHAINERLLLAISRFLPPEPKERAKMSQHQCRFCMSQVTPFDLVWGGIKIGGCAQRKTAAGLLQQVSLFVVAPDWGRIEACVKDPKEVIDMQETSRSIEQLAQQRICRKELQTAIYSNFVEWSISYHGPSLSRCRRSSSPTGDADTYSSVS